MNSNLFHWPVFLALTASLSMGLVHSTQAGTCTVDWNNVHQRIDGFGACSAYAPTMTSAQAATFFGTNSGQMGLSLWRIKINEDNSWSTETANAAYAHQYGAKVLGSPWLAPSAWMSSGSLLPSHYADYANWLSNAAVSINLDYVSIQNEPDFGAQGGWMSWSSTQIFNFMKTNAPAIGRPVVMPESYHFSDAYSDPVINDPVAVSNFAILGGHLYGGGNYVHTNALAHGKPVWMTEHFNQAGNTNTLWATTNILCAVNFAWEIGQCMTNQMSAYIWWRAYHSPYAYDDLIIGTTPATPDVTGYAVAQYARFIRPGYYRIDASATAGSASITAFTDTNSGNFTIVAVNTNATTSISQTFNLNNSPGTVTSVTPWITSATMSLSNQTPVTVSGSSFGYTIPAQSVVTFVGQASPATPVPPTLLSVADQIMNAGQTLLVTNTATDPNVPPQMLSFSLLNNPSGATLTPLNTTNAQFSWRAPVSSAGTTNLVTVAVTNTTTLLSDTNSFKVIVNPLSSQPTVGSIATTNGQVTLVLNGPQGPDYTVLTTTNLIAPIDWQVLMTTNSPVTPVTLTLPLTADPMRFYRIQIGP